LALSNQIPHVHTDELLKALFVSLQFDTRFLYKDIILMNTCLQ